MSSLEERLAVLEAAVADTDRHVAAVARDVVSLTTLHQRSFENVTHQCDRIELELGRLVNVCARHTVQLDQFTGQNGALRDDVSALLKVSARQTTEFADMRVEYAELKAEFGEMKGRLSGLEGEVSGLKGDVSGLKGDVARLEAEFKKGQARHDAELAKLQADVSAILTLLNGKFGS